jgi:cell division protein ZapA
VSWSGEVAQVSVSINGRNYRIACDDGQEEHLVRLAGFVDERVADLVAAVGQIGDTRLMVMASLLIADELSDAYAELTQAQEKRNAVAVAPGEAEAVAGAVEALAERIEALAAGLEHGVAGA